MKRREAKRLRKKRQADHLFRRIFALLQSGEWTVKFARMAYNRPLLRRLGLFEDEKGNANIVGCADPETSTMWLDHRNDVLATLLHECVHVLYPDMRERKVQKCERLLLTYLGAKRARRLTRMLALLLKR